jgi:hypothetical protein
MLKSSMPTQGPRDTRAMRHTQTDAGHRWIWLKQVDGYQKFVRSNYEPTKADGLVGHHKKLLKTKDADVYRAAEILGVKAKAKPQPKPDKTVDFWDTVETVKPKGRFDGIDLSVKPMMKRLAQRHIESLFDDEPETNDLALISQAILGRLTFLHKLANMNDAEEFADALNLLYFRDNRGPFDLYTLFCEAGWAEGRHYCKKRRYVIATAHKMFKQDSQRGQGTREHHERYWKQRKFTEGMLDDQIRNAIHILQAGPEKQTTDIDNLFD